MQSNTAFFENIKHIGRMIKKFVKRDKWVSKQEIMRYLPSRNITMLEAGAFDGHDTVEWSKLLPHAKIYAFEPEPSAYGKLKENVKNFAHVTIFNEALNDIS